MSNIQKKKIAMIGSGFVGQAAGKGFHHVGHDVTFYDVKPDVIESLRHSGHQADNISALSQRKNKDFDFVMLSVPTPTVDGKVSLAFLDSALQKLGEYLRASEKYAVFVVRSTVPPGTTQEFVIPTLEKFSGKKYGQDFGAAMNPEFLREVTAEKDFAHPWITVLGSNDETSAKLLGELYASFNSPITHMSIKEAEMTKYIHNLLNATKISFFNEIRVVSERMGIDPELEFKTAVKSAEAIWNPEYGIKNYGPFGGSCLPKDTTGFFTWAREKYNLELPVLKATIQTNEILKKTRLPLCMGRQGCKALKVLSSTLNNTH